MSAVLVRPSGRRVHCYCVKVPAPELPTGDRVAHLLLALRTDETGFATVATASAVPPDLWAIDASADAPSVMATRTRMRIARCTGTS